ncbi:telomere-associated recq-like helicase [Apiospora arundinis]|uniref:Telomere-associated recq-like helicase n=1 Tax=Apiospora arundinis TaxID=335852 RepID=A0ABR2IXT2_9PEZI
MAMLTKRPVKEIDTDIVDDDDSDHPLPVPLQRHKLLFGTSDTPEFAHFTLDPKQYRKLYTKIERTFRRFDYEPKCSCLTIRMPSPTHDYFATYFRDEICKELNKIASSRSDEAKPFTQNVISAVGSRVLLAETDDENDSIKREPDIQFHYPGARYPGIVVEVLYSQDGKDLRRLAQDYILYSDGDIKLVIGIDLNCRGKPSTVSLWRPRFTESEDGLGLETFEHVHEMANLLSSGVS